MEEDRRGAEKSISRPPSFPPTFNFSIGDTCTPVQPTPNLGKHFARIFHDPFLPRFDMRATQARNAIKLSRSRERVA